MLKVLFYTILYLMGMYVLFRWDYHISNIIFERVCSDPSRVGQHIYERIPIDDSVLIDIPKEDTGRFHEAFLYVSDEKMLNPEWFDKHYKLLPGEISTISTIGPITTHEAKVVRLVDDQTIARAVMVRNQLGWLIRLISFRYQQTTCPSIERPEASSPPKPTTDRLTLVREAFYIEDKPQL